MKLTQNMINQLDDSMQPSTSSSYSTPNAMDSLPSTSSSYLTPNAMDEMLWTRNDGLTNEFEGNTFPHSGKVQNAMKKTFMLNDFRPSQLEAINAALLQHDCFIMLPTGGGKSLCFQLPATLTTSITLVITPLKSLILDQMNKLRTLKIPARHLCGTQKPTEIDTIYKEIESESRSVKVLFLTPEKVSQSQRLKDILLKLYQRGNIARFIIDEAHCIR